MRLTELDSVPEPPDQYAEVGQGAQYIVHMLTDARLAPEHTSDEHSVPRVIKNALGRQAIRAYVRQHIGITDPIAVEQKVTDLECANFRTFSAVLDTIWHPDTPDSLPSYFGEPKFIRPDSPFPLSADNPIIGASYTQNYVRPVAKLLAELNFRRLAHREFAHHIVDQYADLQLLFSRYGFFDVDFKFTDNCGVTPNGNLIMLDFSELALVRTTAEAAVRQQTWRQIPWRREYTQLPQKLQKHFSQTLSQRITVESLGDWGSGRADEITFETNQIIHRLTYDLTGQQIWRRRPASLQMSLIPRHHHDQQTFYTPAADGEGRGKS
jgi:hypothetical protein